MTSKPEINVVCEYSSHMIFKVWDSFIKSQGLRFFCQNEVRASLFNGRDDMSISSEAGIIIRDENELYERNDGFSISICSQVDYFDNMDSVGINAISEYIKTALEQISTWNRNHNNETAIKQHIILFPYHASVCHWNLGELKLKYENNDSQIICAELKIYEPLRSESEIPRTVLQAFEEVLQFYAQLGLKLELSHEPQDGINNGVIFTKQQIDSTSCGVISAENGKNIILGQEIRKSVIPYGARELRAKHVREVNNPRFTEMQAKNEVTRDPPKLIYCNVEDVALKLLTFLQGVSFEDGDAFFKNAGNGNNEALHQFFEAYREDLKNIEVDDSNLLHIFFEEGSDSLRWKENAVDNFYAVFNHVREAMVLEGSKENQQLISIGQLLVEDPIRDIRASDESIGSKVITEIDERIKEGGSSSAVVTAGAKAASSVAEGEIISHAHPEELQNSDGSACSEAKDEDIGSTPEEVHDKKPAVTTAGTSTQAKGTSGGASSKAKTEIDKKKKREGDQRSHKPARNNGKETKAPIWGGLSWVGEKCWNGMQVIATCCNGNLPERLVQISNKSTTTGVIKSLSHLSTVLAAAIVTTYNIGKDDTKESQNIQFGITMTTVSVNVTLSLVLLAVLLAVRHDVIEKIIEASKKADRASKIKKEAEDITKEKRGCFQPKNLVLPFLAAAMGVGGALGGKYGVSDDDSVLKLILYLFALVASDVFAHMHASIIENEVEEMHKIEYQEDEERGLGGMKRRSY